MESTTELSERFQCSLCLSTVSVKLTCEYCQSVYYCSDKCRLNDITESEDDIRGHRFWCQKLLSYKNDLDIKSFPFYFAAETTSCQFTESAYKLFLQQHRIFNQELWIQELASLHIHNKASCGELKTSDDPFILPSESAILDDVNVTVPVTPLDSWSEYYSWRGFRLDSPIAILMQWPLTIYYILMHCMSIDYAHVEVSSRCVIHCIGADKEADLIPAFQELTVLLPHVDFHLCLIGPAISKSADRKTARYRNSRLSASLYNGLYHDNYSRLPSPHFVIGFNAGLVAYTSWIETIQLLAKLRIPAYFTDYCWKSYDLTVIQIKDYIRHQSEILSLIPSKGRLNLFRSPIRIHDLQSDIPAFSNAILFHFDYNVTVSV